MKKRTKKLFVGLRGKILRKLCQQVDTGVFTRHFNRRLVKTNLLLYIIDGEFVKKDIV